MICVPLVRIRAGQNNATSVLSTGNETVGVLYMDSRLLAADLAGGNRELLQTLAIEASTVLENARLLQEEQGKHQMEEELRLARTIQQSLLPASLPSEGWLRASGSSLASHEVGGDYYDVTQRHSALLERGGGRCFRQRVSLGAARFAAAGRADHRHRHPAAMGHRIERLNRFLLERTGGEKYATVFYCLLFDDGRMFYVNAAHCPPMRGSRQWRDGWNSRPRACRWACSRPPNSRSCEQRLAPGDKVVIYSDGVTEAQNLRRRFLRQAAAAGGPGSPRGRLLCRHTRRHSGRGDAHSPKARRNPTTSRWWCWSTAIRTIRRPLVVERRSGGA